MISLTRLNNHGLMLNSDLIKFVENAPDTVITLINGEKIVVRETADQVADRVILFRRKLLAGMPIWTSEPPLQVRQLSPQGEAKGKEDEHG